MPSRLWRFTSKLFEPLTEVLNNGAAYRMGTDR